MGTVNFVNYSFLSPLFSPIAKTLDIVVNFTKEIDFLGIYFVCFPDF